MLIIVIILKNIILLIILAITEIDKSIKLKYGDRFVFKIEILENWQLIFGKKKGGRLDALQKGELKK